MTSTRYSGLAATQQGRTRQMSRSYRGMADEIERRRAERAEDCDDLSSLSHQQLTNLVISLRQQLTDAQNLIDEMRAEANGSTPVQAESSGDYWTTKMVAEKSGVAICTIIRNVDTLGGWQLQSGDWLFPIGTTYGRRRKAK